MNQSRASSLMHHMLRFIILLGFTGYIVYLVRTGEILLFIAPGLLLYVKMAAAGLFLFTSFQLYALIHSLRQPTVDVACVCGHDHHHTHEQDSDHDHSDGSRRSTWKHVILYGMFIFPLLLGALLPNQAFAGSLAMNKGMSLGGTSSDSSGVPTDLAPLLGSEDPAAKALFVTDKYNRDYAKLAMLLYQQDVIEMQDTWFIEKLQALNSFVNPFQGKRIRIKGFVYREEGLSGDQFIIGRMAMTHCIADISPYGMIAEAPNASSYADDTWVTLTGTIASTTYHNQTVVKIMIDNVEPATAPTIPYVYPDWDFAQKLQ
ncbi:TIGR03943 family putative permease subunit [Paenibacillus terrigena]|uniref:TIGR03943 family putative permease subunit n=1 Tax=Paenibacillus terrigena TaxID=369333 RepID=UPI0028D7EE00|nr:TIGR03943 family protein [Paenibacillus terrigena]